MARLLVRRLLLSVLTLGLVSMIIFTATEILPGDLATAILGREATPATLARLRTKLGLDRPAAERYGQWLLGLLRGDLGVSPGRDVPVATLLSGRLRNSLLLCLAAAGLGLPLALLLGIVAGLARDRLPDHIISLVALTGMSIPEFVVGSLLIFTFALKWNLFPAVTVVPPTAPLAELLPNVVLPAITLTLVMVAYIIRLVRTSLIEAMGSEYVQMATLKGVPRHVVVLRHALPNALLPTINAVALTVAWLIGGVVVVETVFNYPGIGRLMVTAVRDRDIVVVQALGILSATIYIVLNLAADLLMLALSPRLRTNQ